MKIRFTLVLLFVISFGLFWGCATKVEEKERITPEKVVQNYMKAKTWNEKKAFVFNYEGISQEPSATSETNEWKLKEIGKPEIIDSLYSKIDVTYKYFKGGEAVVPFYLKKFNDTYKIDIKSTSGYNPMTFTQFFIQKPKEATFRIRTSLMVQPYDFDNSYHELNLGPSVYIAVKKNSDAGKRIFELLKDGEPHQMVVEVTPKYVGGRYSAIVTNLVQDGWLIKE